MRYFCPDVGCNWVVLPLYSSIHWNPHALVLLCPVCSAPGEDFYGKSMRMLLAGFQRREKKFGSFPELVATINKVGVSSFYFVHNVQQ